MNKIDYLDITNRQLSQFLAVFDTGSVTEAALRLGLGQSAVSHTLEKLGKIVGEPLFIRAGRGIVASARAVELAVEARQVLLQMQQMTEPAAFDPAALRGSIWIAVSDLQRELFLPQFVHAVRKAAPHVDIGIADSGNIDIQGFREGKFDFAIMPYPPDNSEFLQRKIFDDPWVCFHDKNHPVPHSFDSYMSRPHALVYFDRNSRSMIDTKLAPTGRTRRVAVRASSFSALANIMRDSDILTTLPSSTARTFMQGFGKVALPFDIDPLPFNFVWHRTQTNSPKNKWLRALFFDTVCVS